MKKGLVLLIVGFLIFTPIAYAVFTTFPIWVTGSKIVIRTISNNGTYFYQIKPVKEGQWYTINIQPIIIKYTTRKYTGKAFHIQVDTTNTQKISNILVQNKEVDVYISFVHTIVVIKYNEKTKTIEYPGGSFKASPKATIIPSKLKHTTPSSMTKFVFGLINGPRVFTSFVSPRETIQTALYCAPKRNDTIIVSPFIMTFQKGNLPLKLSNYLTLVLGVVNDNATAPKTFIDSTVKIVPAGMSPSKSQEQIIFTSNEFTLHNVIGLHNTTIPINYTNYYTLGGTAPAIFILLP